jgi:hypothetical protein
MVLNAVQQVPSPSPPVLPRSQQQNSPSSHPLIGPLTGASTLSAFFAYNAKQVGSLALIVFVGSTIISLWGLWTVSWKTLRYVHRCHSLYYTRIAVCLFWILNQIKTHRSGQAHLVFSLW